jgi:hypothetical protein
MLLKWLTVLLVLLQEEVAYKTRRAYPVTGHPWPIVSPSRGSAA